MRLAELARGRGSGDAFAYGIGAVCRLPGGRSPTPANPGGDGAAGAEPVTL